MVTPPTLTDWFGRPLTLIVPPLTVSPAISELPAALAPPAPSQVASPLNVVGVPGARSLEGRGIAGPVGFSQPTNSAATSGRITVRFMMASWLMYRDQSRYRQRSDQGAGCLSGEVCGRMWGELRRPVWENLPRAGALLDAQQAGAEREAHQLPTALQSQLVHNARAVSVHRLPAQAQ